MEGWLEGFSFECVTCKYTGVCVHGFLEIHNKISFFALFGVALLWSQIVLMQRSPSDLHPEKGIMTMPSKNM